MSDPSSLLQKYRNGDALIDTNILLVYLIGNQDQRLVTSFKRTKSYSIDDYKLIKRLVNTFKTVVTTPNILTEISNLSNSLAGPVRTRFYKYLIGHIPTMHEVYCNSASLTTEALFPKIGLTDAAIVRAARKGLLVITDDFVVSNVLDRRGFDVINFNHIRVLAWR